MPADPWRREGGPRLIAAALRHAVRLVVAPAHLGRSQQSCSPAPHRARVLRQPPSGGTAMTFVTEPPSAASRLACRLNRSTGALGWMLAAILAALLLFTATGQRGASPPRCGPAPSRPLCSLTGSLCSLSVVCAAGLRQASSSRTAAAAGSCRQLGWLEGGWAPSACHWLTRPQQLRRSSCLGLVLASRRICLPC